ncbi:hypothetical protein LCGC14_2227880, partial [marine sediment metagenome]
EPAFSKNTGFNKNFGSTNGTVAQGDDSRFHTLYTNAEAVAAVNAAGLALAATKVITTQDADLTFTFGRAQIDSRFADYIVFSNRDMAGNGQWALAQHKLGDTFLNAPTGKTLNFNINNVFKMGMSASGLNMGIPIAMGANKITGMDDPAANQDAATKIYVDLRLLISEIDNIPVDGVVVAPISSNWAFDHAASPANVRHLTDAQIAALHTILDGYTKAELNGGQLDDRYYTETELDAINAIGIANKRWKLTAYKGAFAYASSHNYINVQNVGGTDMILTYEVLLPPTIGTKNLIITDTRISIPDSENSDYVNAVAMYGRLASGGWDAANWTVDHDVVYGKGIGIFTYGHADITIGGVYKGVSLLLTCINTNARRLDIGNLEVEYYYG